MINSNYVLETEIVAADDGTRTYEIKRTWNTDGRKAVVVELYPTLSVDRCGELDLSTMHLLNHSKELGWGCVRIVNLYSTVYERKPLASQLEYDEENLQYIEGVFKSDDIKEYDIVIATGSSLKTNKDTVMSKVALLNMIVDNKLEGNANHIVPEFVDDEWEQGIHPLFLGLHHSRDQWTLAKYDVAGELDKLSGYLKTRNKNIDEGKKVKARKKKTVKDNV